MLGRRVKTSYGFGTIKGFEEFYNGGCEVRLQTDFNRFDGCTMIGVEIDNYSSSWDKDGCLYFYLSSLELL